MGSGTLEANAARGPAAARCSRRTPPGATPGRRGRRCRSPRTGWRPRPRCPGSCALPAERRQLRQLVLVHLSAAHLWCPAPSEEATLDSLADGLVDVDPGHAGTSDRLRRQGARRVPDDGWEVEVGEDLLDQGQVDLATTASTSTARDRLRRRGVRITRFVRSSLETTISTRAGSHWSSKAPTCSTVRARCRAPRRATSVTRVAGWRPVGTKAGRHTARDLSTR